MKKVSIVFSLSFAALFSMNASAQDMPVGALVSTINCKLNHGVTIAQAVDWARSRDRSGAQPGAEFYREAVVNGNFLENYDFRIATYFGSFNQIVAAAQNNAPPPNHLYTCNQASQSVATNRTVSQENDGFTGDTTVMHTRFCLLSEGETLEDAWDFVTAVNENFNDAGDSSLMQMYSREVGPVPNMDNVGRGVVIASVPATPQSWADRMDLSRNGFQALRGVSSPFDSCNYPAVWLTHATHRSAPQ